MSFQPQLIPPDPQPPAAFPQIDVAGAELPNRIPHFGHMLLFLLIAAISMIAIQLLAFALALGLHLFPHETNVQLMREPRLLIPTMFVSYFAGGLLCVIIFSAIWHKPFAEGVRWDTKPVSRHLLLLLLTGVLVSFAVQALSNFLPIPKELPIDDFFRTPVDVWIVAIFGVFIAPVFEELAFRGFLLPSLASGWDWLTARLSNRIRLEVEALQEKPFVSLAPLADPRWSPAAIVFGTTVTSMCFALLHADQLAHAWAPLSVLFCVSLVLCAVRLRFHSLAASALVHACYNGTIFAMLFFATSGFRHLEKLKQ